MRESADSLSLGPAVVYLLVAAVACAGLYGAYHANDDYWIMIWGERGPLVESALMLFIAAVTFWTRQVLFPRADHTPATPTRSPQLFTASWLIMAAALSIYLVSIHVSQTYRYPTPRWYYPSFFGPAALFFVWNWEVLITVVGSYRRKSLRKYAPATGDVSPLLNVLAERLHRGTQDLIWSMGTAAFFFLSYFGNYYLSVTYYACAVILAVVLFISVWPWYEANLYAREVTSKANKKWADQIECEQQNLMGVPHDQDEFEKWHAAKQRLEALQTEKASREEVLTQFSVGPWLNERRKDLLPVTLLNLAGTYLGLPAGDQLLQFLNQTLNPH